MLLKKIPHILLTCVLALCFSALRAGYDYTPTIIQVSKHNQPDSVGFNLVENLNALFYRKIMDESIYLWDSPAKKLKIGRLALQMMEDKNAVYFKDNEEIFIYEFWKLTSRDFEFQVAGFSFFRRTVDGSKFNLGYIDAADVKTMLSSLVIPTNANGQSNLSYWSAIMSKNYNFNLVKFGNKDFSVNPAASFNLRDQAFSNKKVETNAYRVEDEKEVEFLVLPVSDPGTNNYWIFQALDNYFAENQHEYFNLCLNPGLAYLDKSFKIKVDRIEVVEIWKKNPAGDISYHPVRYRIFASNKPIKDLSAADLEQLGILVQFQPITEFLKDKGYQFTIRRVNYETISGYKSEVYRKALKMQNWNKISYFNIE